MKWWVAGLAAIAAAIAIASLSPDDRIELGPRDDVQARLASADPGATVALAPGTYAGPWVIEKAVTLEASDGARLVVPDDADVALFVTADDVTVEGLAVEGGSSGIVVRESDGVALTDVSIEGSGLHGIEIVNASASISNAFVGDLRDAFAQGIEIRNSDGRPDTIVQDSTIVGGQEGIVSHVSEVVFSNNDVSGTTMRGIVVTEMSDGIVTDNRVVDSAGAGYYCGDMSRCAFERNLAMDVAGTSGGTSEEGWGLVVTYHASAWSSEDRFSGEAGPVHTSLHGKMLERSPLDPGKLSDIAVPALIALAVVLLLMLAATRVARPWARRSAASEATGFKASVLVALAIGILVQSFHMVEHVLQVHRVTVDHVPSRGGLAGPGVDSEWVHLVYNLILLAFLVVVALRAKGFPSGGTTALIGAVLIQGWHGVEHVAKVIQHVATGAKVNPGVIGGQFDLVWFHFTVNLAVYTLCLVGALLWAGALWRERPRAHRSVEPVTA